MDILKQPLITEKISAMNERGVYGFIVEKTAKKPEIKLAVEKTFGVKVVSIRTIRYAAKHKSRYTKAKVVSGFTNAFKKAIVQVADGEVIDFYGEI
ncbi:MULTISPECIES: 50S ribosomal protein L23 [Algoriphagus]|jgi:large subunit ribosomal protein L23|uniref:Large ribosomal subunit protein uL23 n=2 Tax=Algoriphagus TaxID=246875 RepID=A0A327PF46_9BACT|nr:MULTISPECIES: 50S ribosomal protein L23 [Algoriphagus]MEB2781540.1 50S ribosomal protein L23 [Algoriphagus sp. C2-6-M1]MEB2783736.1 50S ribosomal protein L23 [Algoriphagus sp. E1-3-M2]RAI90081.1 large subunit ribosomal protein L23 [Algoriphagus yeomjeoni]SMP31420.1 large subunit ribosomal protein L23 [Algoriphagus winogradskyi]|tara:strand:+ start:711 stop:998 length:288 start_codon:yes stop_codon:yes gene_type:complete